jgi:hypothetical protein
MLDINWWAVLASAASSFLLGGIWYGALDKIWNREAGIPENAKKGHPAKVFGLSFLFSLLSAAAFAWWIGPYPPLLKAVGTGLLVGICFVAASFGVNYQFASRSTTLWLIDGGYHSIQFLLYGLILGLWH